MSIDEQVVRVIAEALWEIGDTQEAAGVLAALRDAGFDICRHDEL